MILYRTKYYGIHTDRVISTAYDHIHKKIGHRQDKARALEKIRSKVIDNTQDKLYERRDNFHEKAMNKYNELHKKLNNGEISFEDWKSKIDLLNNLSKNHEVDINKKWDSYNRKVDYLDKKNRISKRKRK